MGAPVLGLDTPSLWGRCVNYHKRRDSPVSRVRETATSSSGGTVGSWWPQKGHSPFLGREEFLVLGSLGADSEIGHLFKVIFSVSSQEKMSERSRAGQRRKTKQECGSRARLASAEPHGEAQWLRRTAGLAVPPWREAICSLSSLPVRPWLMSGASGGWEGGT